MANEKGKGEQGQKSVKIDDLAESTNASAADQVKGGMRPRAGRGPDTDPEDDEVGE